MLGFVFTFAFWLFLEICLVDKQKESPEESKKGDSDTGVFL